jgi:hypothetical protein
MRVATVAGEPANGVVRGAEMNSTVWRSVKSLSLRQPGDLLGARAEAALRVDQGLLRERDVQVVLAEVMPGEGAAEFGQGAVEALVPGLQVVLDLPRLVVGVADEYGRAGHYHNVVGSRPFRDGAALPRRA